MRWRHVLGVAAVIGLAYLLPFSNLQADGESPIRALVVVLTVYLMVLIAIEVASRGLPAAAEFFASGRLRRRWAEAVKGGDPPPNCPMPSHAAHAILAANHPEEIPIAGGWMRIADLNAKMVNALGLRQLTTSARPLVKEEGDWIATRTSLWVVTPTLEQAFGWRWRNLIAVNVLPDRGGLYRTVRIEARAGALLHLSTPRSDTVHLELIAELVGAKKKRVAEV